MCAAHSPVPIGSGHLLPEGEGCSGLPPEGGGETPPLQQRKGIRRSQTAATGENPEGVQRE